MFKLWMYSICRYVRLRIRRQCSYILCFFALFFVVTFAFFDLHNYSTQANVGGIMKNKVSFKTPSPSWLKGDAMEDQLSSSERPQQIGETQNSRLHIGNNNKTEEDGEKKSGLIEKDNSFERNMILGILKRQYSRRYEFVNLTDNVYTTLNDVTHTCAEGEPPIKQYSKWFKNFCWFENDCGCNEQPSMLRCFPRFHIIGFPKAGTTDLYQHIMMHPDILQTHKETNYWSVVRFIEMGNETEKLRGHDTRAYFTEHHIANLENATVIHKGIHPYLDFYLKPLRIIEGEYGYRPEERKFSKKMFGEGSVTYAYSSLGLRISIGARQNKSPMEVDCNVAKIIRWLTPEAKIIVSLRDPVERLYSDYRNLFNGLTADKKNASDFHNRVINRITMWRQCVSKHSEDYCINSPQFEAVHVHSAIIGLVRSMYVLHLRKWLKEFSRDQIFVVHFEERVAEGKRVISDIVKYLDLDPFTPELLDKVVNANFSSFEDDEKPKRLLHQAGHESEPMLATTKQILQDFYRPYNQKLAKLLNDEKYLWYDSIKQFKIPSQQKKGTSHESLK